MLLEHGMGYGSRDLRPRSSHSSPRTGKPSTSDVLAHTRRRRGTGNSTGRAGRYAKCTEPKPFVPSAQINAWYELPESRMKGNFHVRFGGGRLEKGQQCHLASRLPNTEADRSATTVLMPEGAP